MERYYLVDGVVYDNDAKEIAKVALVSGASENDLRKQLEESGIVPVGSELVLVL